jgi:acetyl esterase/lipase
MRMNRPARLFLAAAVACAALPSSAEQQVIPLWPGVAPGSESWPQKEIEYSGARGEKMVRNVVSPSLTVFPADRAKSKGAAVIVCPGGAYQFLSWQNEGTAVAEWLAARGVAAFVLKYRVGRTPADEEEFRKFVAGLLAGLRHVGPQGPELDAALRSAAAADGRQAVALVRRRAAEWGVAPDRIGLLGFSAGAYLTVDVIAADDPASRPDFAAPIYGGNLSGRALPAGAPPLFALSADDDPIGARAAAGLYQAWKAAGRPAELHLYSKGGHGFGMARRGLPVDHWIERFAEWLEVQGLLKPAAAPPGASRQLF